MKLFNTNNFSLLNFIKTALQVIQIAKCMLVLKKFRGQNQEHQIN